MTKQEIHDKWEANLLSKYRSFGQACLGEDDIEELLSDISSMEFTIKATYIEEGERRHAVLYRDELLEFIDKFEVISLG